MDAMDEILMIEPPPCRSMTGITCFMARKQVFGLIANIRSQASSESSAADLSNANVVIEDVDTPVAVQARLYGASHIRSVRCVDMQRSACPPSLRMISTVSCAAASFSSTQS